MTLAQSSTVGYDLLILAFVGGFAVATLIFWPLLHRAHQKRTQQNRSRPAASGKHHLRKPVRSGSTAVTTLGGPGGGSSNGSAVESGGDSTPADSSAAPSVAPADASPGSDGASAPKMDGESVDIPEQPAPSDRFREHHEAQFERTRSRIAKLRDELTEHTH